MKFQQSLDVGTSRAKLWDLLLDMARVGKCFPGVDRVTPKDDHTYQGVLTVRVGPVHLNLAGSIVVLEQDRDRWHASVRLEGSDRRVGGGVRGTMNIDLKELAPHQTRMEVSSDVSFLGKLGEMGQPIIRKKADSVIHEFAINLSKEAASL